MSIIKRRVRENQRSIGKNWQNTRTDIVCVVHTTVYNYRGIDCMGQATIFSGHRDRIIFEVGKPLRADGRKITKIEVLKNYWVISVEDTPNSACMQEDNHA